MTDKPSARRATPAAEIAFLCAASAIFTLYAGFILGGIFYTEWERMLPPQANHVIMTSLAVVEVVAVMLLLDARRRARGDEQFTILAAQDADIRARLSRRRSTDETTVPIAGVTHRVVYQSASASVVHDPTPALSVGVVAAEVERRMADKIEEFGQREWWRGFNSCVQSGLDGVGADVLRLPGARGRTHR